MNEVDYILIEMVFVSGSLQVRWLGHSDWRREAFIPRISYQLLFTEQVDIVNSCRHRDDR